MYSLSKREEEILLTIWDLKEEAYLVTIRKSINRLTGKELTIGAIHIPLTKLEKAGIIKSYFGESTQTRGGRRKRIYKITQKGLETLMEHKKKSDVLWASFCKSFPFK